MWMFRGCCGALPATVTMPADAVEIGCGWRPQAFEFRLEGLWKRLSASTSEAHELGMEVVGHVIDEHVGSGAIVKVELAWWSTVASPAERKPDIGNGDAKPVCDSGDRDDDSPPELHRLELT